MKKPLFVIPFLASLFLCSCGPNESSIKKFEKTALEKNEILCIISGGGTLGKFWYDKVYNGTAIFITNVHNTTRISNPDAVIYYSYEYRNQYTCFLVEISSFAFSFESTEGLDWTIQTNPQYVEL